MSLTEQLQKTEAELKATAKKNREKHRAERIEKRHKHLVEATGGQFSIEHLDLGRERYLQKVGDRWSRREVWYEDEFDRFMLDGSEVIRVMSDSRGTDLLFGVERPCTDCGAPTHRDASDSSLGETWHRGYVNKDAEDYEERMAEEFVKDMAKSTRLKHRCGPCKAGYDRCESCGTTVRR